MTVLVPALNGLAALLALMVLYLATRRFASRGVATAVVALVATSMAMPVWTLAYSDTMGLLGVVAALALLAARRYGWLAVTLSVLAVTRPVMAPLALVLALDGAYFWRRSTGRTRAVALGTAIWAGMTVLIWPVVAWVATGNPMTYWDTEKAYENPDKPRSWLVWALESGLGGVLAIALVVAVLVWVATRALPSDAPFGWRAWLVAYPIYLGAATFISGFSSDTCYCSSPRRCCWRGWAGHAGDRFRWPPVALWGSACSLPGWSSSSSLFRGLIP